LPGKRKETKLISNIKDIYIYIYIYIYIKDYYKKDIILSFKYAYTRILLLLRILYIMYIVIIIILSNQDFVELLDIRYIF